MEEINHKATIRYVRTAVTGAENAGRADAYRRAEALGVDMEQEWQAVHDMRTRHEHRQLDGQRRPVGEPFEVDGEEILYPGDPAAPGHLIWNCRCRLRGIVAGLEPRARKYRSLDDIEGMTYEEWKESKDERPLPITRQEQIGEEMKWRYIREDYQGLNSLANNDGNGIIKSERGMANGQRTPRYYVLTDADVEQILQEASSIGIPKEILQINKGKRTGYVEEYDVINVRGDVMPDPDSSSARDRMSSRAVLAHEYYGHRANSPSEYAINDWRDEYRASRDAAINAPNLTDRKRADLMVDAYDRAREAGHPMEYDEIARRIVYGY